VYLMRSGPFGAEKPVARIDEDSYVDLSDAVPDFDEAFFGAGGLDRIQPLVAERTAAGQLSRFAGERVGAPIARPHQILCIGLNYRDHAEETGQAVPEEPILFTKSPNTLIGPYDDVRIPRGSTKPDWEVELGVVIARRTSYLDSVDEARNAIAGYMARAWTSSISSGVTSQGPAGLKVSADFPFDHCPLRSVWNARSLTSFTTM